MTPDIDIFVLTYNDGNLACKAIESVLEQSHKNFRLTILENGSTDNTKDLVNKYLIDSRVKIIQNSRNMRSEMGAKYLMKAEAPYLSILFSDDVFLPHRIETMLNAIGDNSAIFSNNYYVDKMGKEVVQPHYISSVKDVSTLNAEGHLRQFVVSGNSLHPCAMLVRSEAYRLLGGFKGYLHRIGDMTFFAKLLSEESVSFIPDKLQRIAVRDHYGNEGAGYVISPGNTVKEYSNFYDLYLKKPILSKINKIFEKELSAVELSGDAERLWHLGRVVYDMGAPVLQDFAFKCMYLAVELDEERINGYLLADVGLSVGEYLSKLEYKGYAAKMGRVTLREYARQFPLLQFLYMTAKRLIARK